MQFSRASSNLFLLEVFLEIIVDIWKLSSVFADKTRLVGININISVAEGISV